MGPYMKYFSLSSMFEASRPSKLGHPMHRFLTDTLRYLSAKSLPAIIAIVSPVLFTRMFVPEAYGMYSLVVSIVIPVCVILSEWGAQPIGRYFSEYQQQGRLETYRATLMLLLLLVGLAASIVGIGLSGFLSHVWGGYMGVAAGALLLTQSLYSLMLPIMAASLDPWGYRFFEIIRSLLQFAISLILILLIGRNPALLVLGQALGLAILLPFFIFTISKKVGGFDNSFYRETDVRRFARYGIPMVLWFFSMQLLNVGDRYVLQAFQGSTSVGIYSANYTLITGVVGLISSPVTLAAFPIIMHMWEGRNRGKIEETISMMTRWYLWAGIGLLSITYIGAHDLFTLVLGGSFREGYPILVPVLAGQILFQVSMLGHKGMELLEHPSIMLKWIGVCAITNLVLNILLVPRYGYLAAGYTTLFSYALYTFLIWFSSKNYIVWRIPCKSLTLAIIIAGAGIIISNRMVGITQPTINAALKIVVFSFFYITGLFVLAWLEGTWRPVFGQGIR